MMSLIKSLLTIVCLWLSMALSAQEPIETTIITPLDGECWWGGLTALGNQMPYASNTKE